MEQGPLAPPASRSAGSDWRAGQLGLIGKWHTGAFALHNSGFDSR